PRSAHGIDKGSGPIPSAGENRGCSQRLQHGGPSGNLPVSVTGQRMAGTIDIQKGPLPFPVEMNHGSLPAGSGMRAPAPNLAESIHYSVLHPEADEHTVVHGFMENLSTNGKIASGVQNLLPGISPDLLIY